MEQATVSAVARRMRVMRFSVEDVVIQRDTAAAVDTSYLCLQLKRIAMRRYCDCGGDPGGFCGMPGGGMAGGGGAVGRGTVAPPATLGAVNVLPSRVKV